MRTLALAVSLLVSALAGPAAAQVPARAAPPPPTAAQPARTIRVSGEGRVQVKPDVARVSAGVQVSGKELQKTSAEAQSRMKAVLEELARLGIAEKDVQTSQFRLEADRPWVNGRQGPVQGYTATNMVRATVRSLDKLPTVLARLTAVGGNAVEGVQFEREDPAPAQREALARAVAAARIKAEVVAHAAGVELGEIVTMDEGGGGRPVPIMPMAAMRKMDEGAPVEPGELEVRATVEVVFGIR
jgi:uncharacterized protein YggE